MTKIQQGILTAALMALMVGTAYGRAGVTLTYQGSLSDAGGQAINASRA